MQLEPDQQHLGHDQPNRLEAFAAEHVEDADQAEGHLAIAGHGCAQSDEEDCRYEPAGRRLQLCNKQCHHRDDGREGLHISSGTWHAPWDAGCAAVCAYQRHRSPQH